MSMQISNIEHFLLNCAAIELHYSTYTMPSLWDGGSTKDLLFVPSVMLQQ
jgi:hypothetical protein